MAGIMRPHAVHGLLLLLVVAFVACSSDESRDPTVPKVASKTLTGAFTDGPVSGLSYAAGAHSGLTDFAGRFDFEAGDTLHLSLGSIVIGSAPATARMSPMNLANASIVAHPLVTSIARFMQTIDDDGDVSNGIQIHPAQRAAAEGATIDFAQTPAVFESDPNVIAVVDTLTSVSTAGPRTLVSAAAAQAHLTTSLRAMYGGDYAGRYCRDNNGYGTSGGTWSMHVADDGAVDMTFTGTPSFQATGTMSLSGTVTIAVLDGPDIQGSFHPAFGGRWYLGSEGGSFYERERCSN
jgi:hypothetical protein